MASDAEDILSNDTIIVGGLSTDVIPATPPARDSPLSQFALPSTEDPGSPIDSNVSFKTELNDDRADATIIPSSLTPPPSSTQLLGNSVADVAANLATAAAYIPSSSQRSALFSPPTTVAPTVRRTAAAVSAEYVPPTPQEVRDAPPDTLRAMVQGAVAENSRLKMEAAHYKLQLNLASLQAGEDAKRAAVEHDMARREVEALRDGESARQARREFSASTESARSKYLQARGLYEEAAGEVEHLDRRLRLAKKVIQQQEDEIGRLQDDRQQLRIRIRENREHFNMLCSPGGIFHGVLTPRQSQSGAAASSNAAAQAGPHARSAASPRHTPGRPRRESKAVESSQHRFDALIQVLSQENNSAPSTPTTGGAHRPVIPRQPPRHTRNVQSLSSLPTTPPAPRNREALLPSAQLAPRTEPPRRLGGGRRLLPDSPRRGRDDGNDGNDGAEARSRSRESTISVPDNEELARQALASVQKASSSLSRLSGASRGGAAAAAAADGDVGEESDVTQSQASAAASEMLRRDPRQSFEMGPPPGGSPSRPAGKAAMYAGDVGQEKRRLSDGARGEVSPPKKMMVQDPRAGLGIQY